ncbi:molybdopterin cofactor-binding domain-containing protein [Roseomonas sp. WA12]
MSGATSRRSAIAAGLAIGGGLLVRIPLRTPALAQPAAAPALNAFVRIRPDGAITLIAPYVEMGQGAYTSQLQILAEELRVDPAVVTVQAAPADEAIYGSPLLGGQITGGSLSLRGAWATLRTAGAAAREMLVEAAAREWSALAVECRPSEGVVRHIPSGRMLPYGSLAAAAAALPVPASPALTDPRDFRVVGRSIPRVDTPSKTTGAAIFGIDVRLPRMRFASVAAAPTFGGRLVSVDSTAALAVPGALQVVQLDNAVAIVATNTFAALKGLELLDVRWDEGPNAKLSTAELVAELDAAMGREGVPAVVAGDVGQAEAAAAAQLSFEFRHPILAHAAMEPLNCTVHVRDDGCDVWVGSQVVGRAQRAVAEAIGIPAERVVVHNQLLGGGFGRRLEVDYVAQAAQIARHVDAPVKVVWSREEDTRQDYFRYLNHSRVTVGIGADGMPVSWRHQVVGPSVMARFLPAYTRDGVDLDIIGGANGPYRIPNVRVEYVRQEAPAGLSTGNWRGVGATRNVVIVESVIDALADRAGQDPVDYRRALLSEPRLVACLDEAARMADWGRAHRGDGRTTLGVATMSDFASHLAVIAEVSVTSSGEVRVHHMWCVIDTGIAVHPDIVRAQIEGGVVFGLSAALWGQITVENGRIVQGNFDTYRVMRMNEAPRIDVHVMSSSEDPGGVGEPGTAAAIAAVANAVARATGERPTALPLQPKLRREARL